MDWLKTLFVNGKDISTKADSHICHCYSTTNNQDFLSEIWQKDIDKYSTNNNNNVSENEREREKSVYIYACVYVHSFVHGCVCVCVYVCVLFTWHRS